MPPFIQTKPLGVRRSRGRFMLDGKAARGEAEQRLRPCRKNRPPPAGSAPSGYYSAAFIFSTALRAAPSRLGFSSES